MNNRRNFLKASILGASSLAFSNSLNGDEITNDKSVIWVWLGGGISSQEFINPSPNSPIEFRSVRGHVKAKSGYELGADFENLAAIGDKLSIVRSFSHRDANHDTATHFVNNSQFQIPNQGQSWPHHGSVIAKRFGPNNNKNGMPIYVKIDKIVYDDAAFLGTAYMGYDADQLGIKNMFPNVENTRFNNRVKFMNMIDKNGSTGDNKQKLYTDWTDLKRQTVDIINGTAAKAFDIDKEEKKYLDYFDVGKSQFGKNCLLAARLVENGAKFVNITHGGWDMHADISKGFENRGRDLDNYLSKLIIHLEGKGILDKTLIVVASEFSRTYRINQNAGRDHFPGTNSLMFAGGGYNHGRVIGSTNKECSAVVDNPFNPEDLAYTIYKYFGIDKFDVMDIQGRPRHLVPANAKDILV